MANILPVRKIYCDTAFKRQDLISNSNFKIDLPYTLKLPDNCVFFVDDVSIPHTWYTIESGVNDKLYVRITLGSANTDYILTLTSQNYDGNQLKVEIDAKIKTLTFSGVALVPTVSYNSQTQNYH